MTENIAKKPNAAFVIVTTLLSMVTGAMCLNKVAPIASTIATSLDLSAVSQTGLLISIFTLAGIFLSLPIGSILSKVGCYRLGLVCLGTIAVGSIIGSLPVDYNIMLVSRVIEGIGMVCLATLGPTIVGIIVPEKHRGKIMGLMMCYMAFGQIIMMNCASMIANAVDWKLIWQITAGIAIVLAVVWLIGLRHLNEALDAAVAERTGATDESKESTGEVLKSILRNPAVWTVALAFLFYIIPEQAAVGMFSQFLTEDRGVAESTAATITSIASIIGIPVGILVGVLTDKFGRKKILLGLLVLATVVYGTTGLFPTELMWLNSVLRGIAVMGIPGVFFSICSESVKPDQISTASGLLNTFQYLGLFLSTFVFGALVDAFGWSMAFVILMIPSAVGVVFIAALKRAK